jgi:hypothetical protein
MAIKYLLVSEYSEKEMHLADFTYTVFITDFV